MVSDLWNNNTATFVPVFYHMGGEAYQPWCTTRFGFFGILYMPYMWWDGWVDGSYTYLDWNADFQARQAVPTDTTISMSSSIDVDQFNVTAQVCIEAGGTTKDLRIYVLQVLDHYPDSQQYYRNAFRQVSTEDLNLPAGQCATVNASFTLDALDLSRPDDVGAVVWAQEPLSSAPAEIFQAASRFSSSDELFSDGFESGDFSAWSAVVQ